MTSSRKKTTPRNAATTTRKRASTTAVDAPGASAASPEAHRLHKGNGHGATVAEVAYGLFVARGYTHGHDVDDWLEAERRLAHLRPTP